MSLTSSQEHNLLECARSEILPWVQPPTPDEYGDYTMYSPGLVRVTTPDYIMSLDGNYELQVKPRIDPPLDDVLYASYTTFADKPRYATESVRVCTELDQPFDITDPERIAESYRLSSQYLVLDQQKRAADKVAASAADLSSAVRVLELNRIDRAAIDFDLLQGAAILESLLRTTNDEELPHRLVKVAQDLQALGIVWIDCGWHGPTLNPEHTIKMFGSVALT